MKLFNGTSHKPAAPSFLHVPIRLLRKDGGSSKRIKTHDLNRRPLKKKSDFELINGDVVELEASTHHRAQDFANYRVHVYENAGEIRRPGSASFVVVDRRSRQSVSPTGGEFYRSITPTDTPTFLRASPRRRSRRDNHEDRIEARTVRTPSTGSGRSMLKRHSRSPGPPKSVRIDTRQNELVEFADSDSVVSIRERNTTPIRTIDDAWYEGPTLRMDSTRFNYHRDDTYASVPIRIPGHVSLQHESETYEHDSNSRNYLTF